MRAGDGQAGGFEVWAARAWNVFNEGKPFGIVYPPMALGGALLIGAVEGDVLAALAAGLIVSMIWARFAFALRGRALLWLLLVPALIILEGPGGLTAVGLGGWLFFTVIVWGSVYYHLRTGAPWTNGLRFWRLVVTNSDPTSGNALEQVPKLTMTFTAMEHVAGGGGPLPVAALIVAAVALGLTARRWERRPWYPEREPQPALAGPLARRAYVIVIDGCNRERLRQASALGLTPTLDRLAAEGTEHLDVRTAAPARTVVCFSSMLTGATPAEHGMRSNFAPRLGVRVPSIFDQLQEAGRRGRLVGIAHLIDPFGHYVVRSVTSVQPTEVLDHSLAAAGRTVVEAEDPDLLVLQLLAADQLGHVRGTRNPEYLEQIAETDRRIAEFLEFLAARDRLDTAAVIVMADHGQGRGIGGHGHLDWGESPVPYIHWGAGAQPGAVAVRRASVLELAVTLSRLLGVDPPSHARGQALMGDAVVPSPARALAVITAYEEEATIGAVIAGLPDSVEGVPLDVLVVDDGGTDRTAEIARAAGARVVRHESNRGLGAALRTGLERAREDRYDAALYLDGDGEYDPAQAARVLAPVLRGQAEYVLGSRFLGRREGMSWHRSLANRASSALLGALLGGRVITDGQTGYRAFGSVALERFSIAHDYNYAQTLTIHLHLQGIEPLEVPIDYRRRAAGESFVRYGEYARRVVPTIYRQLRDARRSRSARPSRTTSSSTAAATPAATASAQADSTP